MIRDNLYRKIVEASDHFKSVVEHKTEKTPRGWRTPYVLLEMPEPPDLPWSTSIDPTRPTRNMVTLEPLEWVGEDKSRFDLELSNKLFLAITDALSPQGIVFWVYLKGPEVDNIEGPGAAHRHFKRLGKAFEYAQELIREHFRDKGRRIPFPEVEYLTPSRVFDQGPYASSVILQPIKLED